MPTVDDALSYSAIGWSIIPCKKDKRPYVSWAKYQKEKPTDEQIRKWWSDYPDANIAVITGEVSGIVGVDIDSPKGELAYKSLFGEVHNTVRQSTGKEGAYHLVFKYPKGYVLSNTARQAEDIDTRAAGGYILLDPSIHPTGRKYQWVIDPRESIEDLMDLPPDVRAYFWPPDGIKQGGNGKIPLDVQSLLMGVEEGRRDDSCTKLAGYYLRVFGGDVKQTEQVLELWNTRNNPPMEWKQVRKVVASIARKQGREEVGEQTGAFIKELEKHVYPDGSYKYVVYPKNKDGFFTVSSKDLADQSGFILRYMEAMDHKLPRIKAKDWDGLLNKLLAEVKVVMISEDETDIGIIKEAILNEIKRPVDDMAMIDNNKIVVREGLVYFKTKSLLDRVRFQNNKIEVKGLGQLLRKIGAKNGNVRVGEAQFWCWTLEKKEIC